MNSKRIELKGEEILETLTPLRKRWAVYKTMREIAFNLCFFGFIAYFFGTIFIIQSGISLPLYLLTGVAVEGVLMILVNVFEKFRNKAKQEYADTYKGLISKPVLDSCFDNARFEPKAGYPREDFKASGLLPITNFYTYDSEDLITGTYKGVAFRRADVRITHQSGGKNRTTVVDADGRLLEVAYHKEINDTIRIVKESEAIVLFGEDVLVETEDMEFNRKFNVYARDKHSAFYLLTPQFIEYIKQLSDKEDRLFITFDGEKLYILLSGHGGIFEPPFKEFDLWDEVRKCKAELAEIDEIIDNLQLDVAAEQNRIMEEAMQDMNGEIPVEQAYQPKQPSGAAPGRTTNAAGIILLIILLLFILLPVFLTFLPFILQANGV